MEQRRRDRRPPERTGGFAGLKASSKWMLNGMADDDETMRPEESASIAEAAADGGPSNGALGDSAEPAPKEAKEKKASVRS